MREIPPSAMRAYMDRMARESLYGFLHATFPVLHPGMALRPNWHLEAIAHKLMEVAAGRNRRLIIALPPRHLKSVIGSVALPAWMLGVNPSLRIVCASYSLDLALKLSGDCRSLIGSDTYRRIFPQMAIDPNRRDANSEYYTTRGGSRYATGVEATMTGRGGDLIIIDDPMKALDAHSEAAREHVKTWYRSTVTSRLDSPNKGAFVIIAQRLHVDDLIGYLLDAEEKSGRKTWDVLRLPAIASEDEKVAIGAGRTHLRHAGDLLHPAHMDEAALDQIRFEDPAMFAAAYQQNPTPPDGNLVSWSAFQVYDGEPPNVRGGRTVQSWDTAFSERESADYSACATFRVVGDNLYLIDMFRRRMAMPQLLAAVDRQRQLYGATEVLIENKTSGMTSVQLLRRQGVSVIPVDPKGDKIMRLQDIVTYIHRGQVLIPRTAPWLDGFRKEISAFPHGRNDDQVDAFVQAIQHLKNPKLQRARVHFPS